MKKISAFKIRCRQRVIFPGGGPPSIFTAVSLYDRVRDGNGWFPHAWSPTNSFAVRSKLHNDYKFTHHQLLPLFAIDFLYSFVLVY